MEKDIYLDDLIADERERLAAVARFEAERYHAISIRQAAEVAFRPSKLTFAAEHVDGCGVCRARIDAVRKHGHPEVADLLGYFAGTLPEPDQQEIGRHLAAGCPHPICDASGRLKAIIKRIKETVALNAPWPIHAFTIVPPEQVLLYSPDAARLPFSQHVHENEWEILIEEKPEDLFFIGIRSSKSNSALNHIDVGVLRGKFSWEGRLAWQQDQHFEAKTYVPGLAQLLDNAGPISVVVLPQFAGQP